MDYCKVTAIVRSELLEKVEQKLQEIGVGGISVTTVKGYGECADFYANDLMVSHSRIEIFTVASRADHIAKTLMDSAHLGLAGDGIVAVVPVQKLYRIRTKSEVTTDEV